VLKLKQESCEILHIHMQSTNLEPFAEWQEQLHASIAKHEGFISLEILSPKDPSKPIWTIIQRFSSMTTLESWLHSIAYQHIHDTLKLLCSKCDKVVTSSSDFQTGVTEVFVTKVSPEQSTSFQKWLGKIHKAEATFTGFQRVYTQAPKDHLSDTWITLLQFDTKENLENWLCSDIRQAIVQEAESLITSIESHRVISPYSGWFATGTGELSLIKQTMLVLLVLYPIVMLQLAHLTPLTSGMPAAPAMFLANTISVMLITWPCMPLCLSLLSWWLKPKNLASNLLGTFLVLVLYVVEIAIFW
jgi:uncharacterized protein